MSEASLNEADRELLLNVLDALDRLFDRHVRPIDTYALLLATSKAVQDETAARHTSAPVSDLLEIVRSTASDDQKYARALDATAALRDYLADVLY